MVCLNPKSFHRGQYEALSMLSGCAEWYALMDRNQEVVVEGNERD